MCPTARFIRLTRLEHLLVENLNIFGSSLSPLLPIATHTDVLLWVSSYTVIINPVVISSVPIPIIIVRIPITYSRFKNTDRHYLDFQFRRSQIVPSPRPDAILPPDWACPRFFIVSESSFIVRSSVYHKLPPLTPRSLVSLFSWRKLIEQLLSTVTSHKW